MMKKMSMVIGVFVTLFFVGCQNSKNVDVAIPTSSQSVTITIAGIESPQEYRIEIENEETVASVMQKARAQGLTYEIKEFTGLGSLVISINGIAQTNTMVWIYAVNGKKATQGIAMQSVRAGDRIEWTYESLRF